MVLYQDLAGLKELLTKVLSSKESDFYRKKFDGISNIDTIELGSIPALTRDELVEVEPWERCYIRQSDVDFVAYTSGTSSGKPLLSIFALVDNYHVEPDWGTGVNRLLIVFPPLNKNFAGTFIQQCREANHPVVPVFGDPTNLSASAYLGSVMKIDALYVTPSLAFALAPFLRERNLLKDIKLLAISGETITDSQLTSLYALYPNALVANLYASSEIGQFIMGPTLEMMRNKIPGFVLITESLVAAELVDDELVVTYANNPAFPLIRYKTGDLFVVNDELTKTYNTSTPVLEWAGKGGIDLVRVHGLEIRSGSVESFFESLSIPVKLYQLHVFPGSVAETITLKLEFVPNENATDVVEYIRQSFLDKFKLGLTGSLTELLNLGIVESVVVSPVNELSWQGSKRRVLVNHIS